MSGELKAASGTGLTVYGHILNASGSIWNGSAFEGYALANYSTYTVTMTEQSGSGIYVGDFPSLITTTGTYEIFYYSQLGGSPASGDVIIGSGSITLPVTTTSSTTPTSPGLGMSFLEMQEELSDRLAVYDNTIAADATRLKRWLNMAQRDISARQNWPFMLAHEIVQTVTDITTGTATIAAGATSLTLSSAPAVSVADWFIKLQNDSNWYKIVSHTAGSMAAVITPAYGGTTNATAVTYQLRKLFYATSTPLDSVLDMKIMSPGRFLESASSRDTDVFLPLYWDAGATYKYISSVPDSSGNIRFSLLYSPSTIVNLQVRGIKRLPALTTDTDSSIIPPRWHSGIIDLAAFYGFSSVDDNRAKTFFERAEQMIQSMSDVFGADLGRLRVSRSLNAGVFEGPAYVLPPQYGVPM